MMVAIPFKNKLYPLDTMPVEKKALPTGQRSIQSFFTKKAIPLDEPAPGPVKSAAVQEKTLPEKELVICNKGEKDVSLQPGASGCSKDWIGKGVQVYWDGEDAWFGGIIRDVRVKTQEFLVDYVDGDEEWVMASRKDEWKFDSGLSSGGGARKARAGKGRTVAMVDSSDEEDNVASSGSEYAATDNDTDDDDDDDDLLDEDEDEDMMVVEKPPQKKGAKKRQHDQTQNIAPNTVTKTPSMVASSAGRLDITPSSVTRVLKTPGSAQRLKSLLDSPLPTMPSVGKTPELAHRFSQREAERFPFLHKEVIKDKKMRRPSDPEYDSSTLHIPPQWFKEKKISEGQRQWWEFKSQNFDSVLLFKMGKFYELFEMDAHVGAECLGLSYMKGDQPHVGFPEAAYAQMVERLVRAGYRASVVEQVETPEMLAARNLENKKAGRKKENVVKREKVAVISKATITDGEMMQSATESDYLACIVDSISDMHDEESKQGITVGFVAVDVASARVIMGQFKDDELRSHLRSILTALKPVELVIPREESSLSGPSRKVIKGILRQPLIDERPVGEQNDQFLSADAFWDNIKSSHYFQDEENMPPLLKKLRESQEEYSTLSLAMGGLLGNLKRGLIDKWVLCGSKFHTIEDIVGQLGRTCSENSHLNDRNLTTMALDGAALENLEILENADGGLVGTLLGSLDHCVTPFGKRKLREWLCRPLFKIEDIVRRQDAVQDLLDVAEESAGEARRHLAGLTDIERAIVRLSASGIGVGPLRESSRVILYEDVSKKKIKAISSTLSDIKKTISAVEAFSGVDMKSHYLKSLVAPSSFPDIKSPLEEFLNCVDWAQAEASGRIKPQQGTDEAYDNATDKVKQAERDLEDYLISLQSTIRNGSKSLKYTSLNKEPYVLEAPDTVEVPSSWESIQGKKGFRRYMTDELKKLSSNMSRAIEEKEVAQTQILQNIMKRFAAHKSTWLDAVDCIAKLDALMSLAKAAACGDGIMCRPEFVECNDASVPIFRAKALRHPAGIGGYTTGGFVPNDICIGGEDAPFMLLTGPNMGGKSTIMRQVCLATIAAQIGAWIPAEKLELSPADAVFVRMGAKDHIMLGQSTFFIELSETAAALHRATRHSLVALDELGRGTATVDGSSIAASVLEYLAHTVCCRGIFATHYHNVAESFENDEKISLKHMGCTVTEANDGTGVDDVVFLYQLAEGSCPKSYGSNVAKLAGLPLDVVSRASTISHALNYEASKTTDASHNNAILMALAVDARRLLTDNKTNYDRDALTSIQQRIKSNSN